MPKLLGRTVASSVYKRINGTNSRPPTMAIQNLVYSHSDGEKEVLHLSASPIRGPASLAFAATDQIALNLGQEQTPFPCVPSHDCILNQFSISSTSSSTSATTPSNSPKRKTTRNDPFIFDNFLPVKDSMSTSSSSRNESVLKKSKSFSRKRRSVTSLNELSTAAAADPYPTSSSKVMRTGLKKSPSRYHLADLNAQAEASTQDEILPINRSSSSSLAFSEQENVTPSRDSAPTLSWGQFADLEQEEDVLEF